MSDRMDRAWLEVLKRVDDETLLTMRRVSKRLAALVDKVFIQPTTALTIVVRSTDFGTDSLSTVGKQYRNVTIDCISLFDAFPQSFHDFFRTKGEAVWNLSVIDVYEKNLAEILEMTPNLRSLRVIKLRAGSCVVKELPLMNLEHLELVDAINFEKFLPHKNAIGTLRIKQDVLPSSSSLLTKCESLKSLTMVTKDFENLPVVPGMKLQELVIETEGYCMFNEFLVSQHENLTKMALNVGVLCAEDFELVLGLLTLVELEIDVFIIPNDLGYENLMNSTIKKLTLRKITGNSAEFIEKSLKLIKACKHVEVLSIYEHQITSNDLFLAIRDSLVHLTTLNLEFVPKGLANFDRLSAQLQLLTIESVTAPSDLIDLAFFVAHCPSLRKLFVNNCTEINESLLGPFLTLDNDGKPKIEKIYFGGEVAFKSDVLSQILYNRFTIPKRQVVTFKKCAISEELRQKTLFNYLHRDERMIEDGFFEEEIERKPEIHILGAFRKELKVGIERYKQIREKIEKNTSGNRTTSDDFCAFKRQVKNQLPKRQIEGKSRKCCIL